MFDYDAIGLSAEVGLKDVFVSLERTFQYLLTTLRMMTVMKIQVVHLASSMVIRKLAMLVPGRLNSLMLI